MTPTTAKEAWARMSPEERLAMAKAAPKVAGPWHTDGTYSHRTDGHSAEVFGHTGTFRSLVHSLTTCAVKDCATLAEAQSACDAELIRQGYVLENDE